MLSVFILIKLYLYINKNGMLKLKDLLNEAYGSQKLSADLEGWAKKQGVNFKKLSTDKKPGNYGGSTSNTFYQIGDKFALVRYVTVGGAPRLNELSFFLIDKPDMTAKVLGSAKFVEEFYDIESVLKRAGIVGGKEATNWDKPKIEKLIKDLSKDKKYNKFSDDQAFEMAQSILRDNEGLEAAIEKVYRVRDAAGWLANKI